MEKLHISLPSTINVKDFQDILECVMVHSDFYTDIRPEVINLSDDGFSLVFKNMLLEEEKYLLEEAIEIDLPVQAKFQTVTF